MPKSDKRKFDELILSRSRLGILGALMGGDELEFVYLRKALGLSDGNLSVQIRKLEERGYLKVQKVFVQRKPKTFCKITSTGRKAMKDFIKHLEELIGGD